MSWLSTADTEHEASEERHRGRNAGGANPTAFDLHQAIHESIENSGAVATEAVTESMFTVRADDRSVVDPFGLGGPIPSVGPGSAWDDRLHVGTIAPLSLRMKARLIDTLLIATPTTVAGVATILLCPTEPVTCSDPGLFHTTAVGAAGLATCAGPKPTMFIPMVVATALLGMALAYYVVIKRDGFWGRSVGRKAMGLRLVDRRTGCAIGVTRAAWRLVLSYTVSPLVLGLGYVWAVFGRDRQTWHDRAMNSVVVVDD